MAETQTDKDLIEALKARGDARQDAGWATGDPDYVAEYRLTPKQVPALISMAIQWVDEPPENNTVYGPVHAWRALGQMRAWAAVQPLLDVQDELDRRDDDWYLEEFHDVFGLIGPTAIEPLETYLSDDSHGELPRSKSANGLREIARRFPDVRDRVIQTLARQLARQKDELSELNAFIIGDLLELKAVEVAEEIEQAFAANVVDPEIVGDWKAVRELLGVPGLGIAPDHAPGWTARGQGYRPSVAVHGPGRSDRKSRKQVEAKRRQKAKRKQQQKDRKRNRRPR